MLHFVCPHCEKLLRVPRKHLGAQGACNKCGGRIALLGRADAEAPQRASKVADAPVGPERGRAATEKQLVYLRGLGAPEAGLRGLSRDGASARIEMLKRERRLAEPATEKQRSYLRRLGAPEELLARADSKEAASALIEALHLEPTHAQRQALRSLGATGAQMAGVKNRAAAESMIASLRAASARGQKQGDE